MANAFITTQQVAEEIIALFVNTNAIVKRINRSYEKDFTKGRSPIGYTENIRLPNSYVVRTGTTAVPSAITEKTVPLTIQQPIGVDLQYTAPDLRLYMGRFEEFSKRFLNPAANQLAAQFNQNIFSGIVAQASNMAWNSNAGALVSPVAETALDAGAILSELGAASNERSMMVGPRSESRVVSSLSGLFNPQVKIGAQYETGMLSKDTLGLDWYRETSVDTFTNPAAITATVNGANQTGTAIVVTALNVAVPAGTIISFAGVNSVNRLTGAATGRVAQFVVTAAAAVGATTLNVYPALNNVMPYQTVDSLPVNTAAISLVGPASTTFRRNLALQAEAVTMVTVDPVVDDANSAEITSVDYDGIRLTHTYQLNAQTLSYINRVDIMYGFAVLRPEWLCIMADIL